MQTSASNGQRNPGVEKLFFIFLVSILLFIVAFKTNHLVLLVSGYNASSVLPGYVLTAIKFFISLYKESSA